MIKPWLLTNKCNIARHTTTTVTSQVKYRSINLTMTIRSAKQDLLCPSNHQYKHIIILLLFLSYAAASTTLAASLPHSPPSTVSPNIYGNWPSSPPQPPYIESPPPPGLNLSKFSYRWAIGSTCNDACASVSKKCTQEGQLTMRSTDGWTGALIAAQSTWPKDMGYEPCSGQSLPIDYFARPGYGTSTFGDQDYGPSHYCYKVGKVGSCARHVTKTTFRGVSYTNHNLCACSPGDSSGAASPSPKSPSLDTSKSPPPKSPPPVPATQPPSKSLTPPSPKTTTNLSPPTPKSPPLPAGSLPRSPPLTISPNNYDNWPSSPPQPPSKSLTPPSPKTTTYVSPPTPKSPPPSSLPL